MKHDTVAVASYYYEAAKGLTFKHRNQPPKLRISRALTCFAGPKGESSLRSHSSARRPREPKKNAGSFTNKNWLVVDLPLWKILYSPVGIIIANIWENKQCSKPLTRWCLTRQKIADVTNIIWDLYRFMGGEAWMVPWPDDLQGYRVRPQSYVCW